MDRWFISVSFFFFAIELWVVSWFRSFPRTETLKKERTVLNMANEQFGYQVKSSKIDNFEGKNESRLEISAS